MRYRGWTGEQRFRSLLVGPVEIVWGRWRKRKAGFPWLLSIYVGDGIAWHVR